MRSQQLSIPHPLSVKFRSRWRQLKMISRCLETAGFRNVGKDYTRSFESMVNMSLVECNKSLISFHVTKSIISFEMTETHSIIC